MQGRALSIQHTGYVDLRASVKAIGLLHGWAATLRRIEKGPYETPQLLSLTICVYSLVICAPHPRNGDLEAGAFACPPLHPRPATLPDTRQVPNQHVNARGSIAGKDTLGE